MPQGSDHIIKQPQSHTEEKGNGKKADALGRGHGRSLSQKLCFSRRWV